MTAESVLELLDMIAGAGADLWVDGGWGVDALLGEQTPAHADLDLVIAREHVARVQAVLEQAGFEVLRDWLPAALAFAHPDGREVDLHPVSPTDDGGGDQDPRPEPTFHYGPPATGAIGGRSVCCVSAESQLAAHLGYAPAAPDRADVAALVNRFGLCLPPGYEPGDRAC